MTFRVSHSPSTGVRDALSLWLAMLLVVMVLLVAVRRGLVEDRHHSKTASKGHDQHHNGCKCKRSVLTLFCGRCGGHRGAATCTGSGRTLRTDVQDGSMRSRVRQRTVAATRQHPPLHEHTMHYYVSRTTVALESPSHGLKPWRPHQVRTSDVGTGCCRTKLVPNV